MLHVEKEELITSRIYATSNSIDSKDSPLRRLISIFPGLKPANLPIHVGMPARANGVTESSRILFRGHDVAIMVVNFQLYGGESVLLRPLGGLLPTSAVVVAHIYNEPGLAVAVRFLEEVPTWFLK